MRTALYLVLLIHLIFYANVGFKIVKAYEAAEEAEKAWTGAREIRVRNQCLREVAEYARDVEHYLFAIEDAPMVYDNCVNSMKLEQREYGKK